MLAAWYGWSLVHIFEYVTIEDVRELSKYAIPRRQRQENYQFKALGNIIRVASFHEKGSEKYFNDVMAQFTDHDESYTERKFDKAGLNALAGIVASNNLKR